MDESSIDRRFQKLPIILRKYFDDTQRFLVVSLLCGALCGVVAVLFHFSIEALFGQVWTLAQRCDPVAFCLCLLLAPTLGGLLVGWGVSTFAPNAIGSGIPQTKVAYYNKRGLISLKDGLFRFIFSSLYVGLGNSLGREGPTVHACAAISSKLGRWLFRKQDRQQALLPIGMAAGISAAFNAPISAIIFVFEDLLDTFSVKEIGSIMLCVVIAAVISRLWIGEDPVIPILKGIEYTTSWWMLIAVPLGVIAGYFGHFFVRGLLAMRGSFRKNKTIPVWGKPALGGLSCGVLGVSAYFLTQLLSPSGVGENGVFSIGYESLQHAFEGKLTLFILLILLVFKTLAVMINFASGGSGGLFSPTLFIGGIYGGVLGTILMLLMQNGAGEQTGQIVGGCVLLGMGAMFASVMRCPFTSILMIYELTGNYTLILPLMFGNILSFQIARRLGRVSLYNALLIQDKINIRKFPFYRGSKDYQNLPVSTIMTHEPYSLKSHLTCSATLELLKSHSKKHHGYPVIAPDGGFVGLVMHHELNEHSADTLVQDITTATSLVTITPETSIQKAAQMMINHDFQQLPVVSSMNESRLLGFLTLNDIARQQNASGDY